MKYKSNKTCYFCSQKSTSTEHAPPSLFFKGFVYSSITVPSCDIHNSKKSGADQAIVSGLLQSLEPYLEAKSQDVNDAFERARGSFIYTKHSAIRSPVFMNAPKHINLPDLAYITPKANIKMWVKQLTAALIYWVTKHSDPFIDWTSARSWSPHFSPAPASSKVDFFNFIANPLRELAHSNNKFSWSNGWMNKPYGYPKTIYYFHFRVANDRIYFRHTFYDTYQWFVSFKASRKTVEVLTAKYRND
ncbi:hypothetical protein HUU42_15950 [bacterium]|nr:hypothetical protein [bacterium]